MMEVRHPAALSLSTTARKNMVFLSASGKGTPSSSILSMSKQKVCAQNSDPSVPIWVGLDINIFLKIHVMASYVVLALKICFSHAKAIKKSSFLTRRRTFLPRGFRFRKSFFMCTFLEVFLYRQLIMSARGFFTILYPRLLLFVVKDLNLNPLSLFSSLSMKVGTAWKVFPVHLVALD